MDLHKIYKPSLPSLIIVEITRERPDRLPETNTVLTITCIFDLFWYKADHGVDCISQASVSTRGLCG
jgi:hypothetical protein